ncbi:hypothetical protein Avbf_06820 [Armadillidium vulgare]|nr:hypothetical protein Avbf_06820 [Armadillidium vulgare]
MFGGFMMMEVSQFYCLIFYQHGHNAWRVFCPNFGLVLMDTVIICDVNKKAGQEILTEFERTIKKY